MVFRRVFGALTVKWQRKTPAESAQTHDESEPAEALDETEPPTRVGHRRENRWSERQAKNTTGLKPGWNGNFRAQSVATQERRALHADALGGSRMGWRIMT